MPVLTAVANRIAGKVLLKASEASIAVDAVINRTYTLPAGFGDLLMETWEAELHTLSGAYVAPAPNFDGFRLASTSTAASTDADILGSRQWVNEGTVSARPELTTFVDLHNKVLIRQDETLVLRAPIIGGAGVTATIAIRIRGLRLRAP